MATTATVAAPAHRHPERPAAELEMSPGGMSQTAADRLAALTARASSATCAMIHVTDGRHMRLIGGHALPPGFSRMQQVPISSTLAGLVLASGFPVVITDLETDSRVPADAPVRSTPLRSYAGFPVRDPDSQIVGVCAVSDVRPRDWLPEELTAVDDGAQACRAFVAEQRARESEHRQRVFLDTLLDSLDTGVAACDADGNLVLVNRSLRERLDMRAVRGSAEEWAARLPITDTAGTPVGADQTPLLRALHGEPVRGTQHMLHIHGERRLFRINGHPLIDAHARRLGAVAVFHDITAAHHAERLQQLLNRTKDDYLNLVGHELRTPLTIIESYLDLLDDAEPDVPAEQLMPMIAAARRGSARLRRLVEALLDLSALDAGHSPLKISDIDLRSVVTEAIHVIEPRAAAKNITIRQDLLDRMPLPGDQHRLRQLVLTLLDNAVNYTPPGGAVTVRLSSAGATVRLEVSDTGLGMPPHERPHVFQRFFRGAIATELAIPGAGLGLTTAQLIAERHHGTITAHPNERERPGTTIRVTLPQ
jgi:two-component system phosphate regulon sensor histidine kinase PhoR